MIAQLTADQVIEPLEAFVDSVERAFVVAETDPAAIVTLGVVPTEPHTGFGYLHRGRPVPGVDGACEVESFTEKPDAVTAAAYVDSGEYWWNAGMFVFRAATLLDQLAVLEPATLEVVRELAERPDRLGELFGTLRKISIDYAVMEPVSRGEGTAHVVAVPLPIMWRDVGGFPALAEALGPQPDGNVISGAGPTVRRSSGGNLVVNTTEGHLVSILGVEGLVVVHTPDATLVTTFEQAEQVKALVEQVAATAGTDYV